MIMSALKTCLDATRLTRAMAVSAIALSGAAFAAQPALAEEESGGVLGGEFSANVGFFSDYIYRGFTQTNNEAAIQGGIDWAHGSGFYVGSWGSNVDFNDGDQASVEVDIYAGFSNTIDSIDPALSYDVGALFYWYPGAADSLDYDFWELYGSLSYDFDIIAPYVGIAWSPDFFGSVGDAYYYQFGADVPLPADFSLSGSYNLQRFEQSNQTDYEDWYVGLGYTLVGLDLSVAYTDTSDDAGDNGAITFGVSKSF